MFLYGIKIVYTIINCKKTLLPILVFITPHHTVQQCTLVQQWSNYTQSYYSTVYTGLGMVKSFQTTQ